YYTRTNQGSPLKLQVPSEPGNYEVRYILGQGVQLLAKTAITLKAVSATLQAPAVAAAGSKIDVAWQGPANQPDYISIARPDQEAGRYLYYTYAKQGSPLKLQLPSEPGTYEVRYILGSETRLLARTAITIQPVTASVSPPATAAANALFEVQWQGPGYPPDYIAIAKPGMPDNRYIHYVYTRTGNPVKLKAPEEAGTYEVRYIMGQEARLLDRKTITVK
ncbi:MAG: VWA domain-containing protein, partial [Deltaproteobacteria bacterium HGW-Deltaproteobacteria-15]